MTEEKKDDEFKYTFTTNQPEEPKKPQDNVLTVEEKPWQSPTEEQKTSSSSTRTYVGIAAIIIIGIASFAFFLGYFSPTGAFIGGEDSAQAKTGDLVSVWYALRVDGELFDTNIESLRSASTLEPLPVYEPLQFTIGQGEVIPGFNNGVIGMRKGEKKTLTVSAEDGYGPRDPTQVEQVPRVQEVELSSSFDRDQALPRNQFATVFGKEPVLGEKVESEQLPLDARIVEITETEVIIRAEAEIGQKFRAPDAPWDSLVTNITNTTITITQQPEQGQIIDTPLGDAQVSIKDGMMIFTVDPTIGAEIPTFFGTMTIVGFNEENITLDTNHPLAGKTLNFEIELIEIKEGNAQPSPADIQQFELPQGI